MKNFKGYVQVYTGNGKGKTTAALGLCLRAFGAKLNVYIGQFMKTGEYSEIVAIKKLSNYIKIEQFGSSEFIYKDPSIKDIQIANLGLKLINQKACSGKYDVVVMDEANVAISIGLIKVYDVIDIINNKSKSTELIITGRNADPMIINRADLVTKMEDIKHYYKKGVQARIGIEK